MTFSGVVSKITGVKFKTRTAAIYAVVRVFLLYGNITEILWNVSGRGESIRTGV